MEKDFDTWNSKKKIIHADGRRAFCHPREIWWCSLGVNIGFEQDGVGDNFKRPIIVIRRFNENIFWAAALTSKAKTNQYYFPLGIVDGKEAFVILSQIRIIDTKRLIRKIGTLDRESFEKLKSALKRTLFE